eukprot:6213446-Pleurochrysis_carterae.AAC.3
MPSARPPAHRFAPPVPVPRQPRAKSIAETAATSSMALTTITPCAAALGFSLRRARPCHWSGLAPDPRPRPRSFSRRVSPLPPLRRLSARSVVTLCSPASAVLTSGAASVCVPLCLCALVHGSKASFYLAASIDRSESNARRKFSRNLNVV